MVKLNGRIFLIEDDNVLKKYNMIWDKVIPHIKQEIDNEPVYNVFENQNKIS